MQTFEIVPFVSLLLLHRSIEKIPKNENRKISAGGGDDVVAPPIASYTRFCDDKVGEGSDGSSLAI